MWTEHYANLIISKLKENNINAYIWHKATSNSVYIRFKDSRIGSIRLADHTGRSKLKYKFNLRSDLHLSKPKWVKDNNTWRYYAPLNCYNDLINQIINRANDVKKWNFNKFTYTIPKFKHNLK
jgi:hypothetical protein